MPKKEKKVSHKKDSTLIVGLGVSAGEPETLRAFLKSLPEHSGIAFVVSVRRLPEREGNTGEHLQEHTSLKVQEITGRTQIEPDNIYVVPLGKALLVKGNHLELSESGREAESNTIDMLFRSLAENKGNYAGGVIFSGTGSDGSEGIKSIKECGGITIVQSPEEASQPGMPKSAIETGMVDEILPLKGIADILLEYSNDLSLGSDSQKSDGQNHIHGDLESLIESTDIGIVSLDKDCCVHRFTSSATEVFDLTESDIGRPLGQIAHSLNYEGLIDDVEHVIKNLDTLNKTVVSEEDRWFLLRLRPNRSEGRKEMGALLTFTEFTELEEAKETIRSESFQESLALMGVYALEHDDLQAILKRVIDVGCTSLKLDCAIIYALNKEQNTFEISAQAGCAKAGDPLPVDKKWDVGFALQNTDDPYMIVDYGDEKRFNLTPYLEDQDIATSIKILIRGTEETYGLLGFYSYEKRSFTEQELNFLKVLANITGMAIQDKNIKEQLRQENERNKRYQQEILHNSIIERWDLGGYLHDDLAQKLVSVKISLQDMKKKISESESDVHKNIEKVTDLIDEGIADIRNLTNEIVPVDIEAEGVKHAFRMLMRQLKKSHDFEFTLSTDKIIEKIRDKVIATNLYRIIQEAVKNSLIHGDAGKIKIEVKEEDGNLLLQITDNGNGFSNTTRSEDSSGINIMKHRMELLGGTFHIKDLSSSGGTGTRVSCRLPKEILESNS